MNEQHHDIKAMQTLQHFEALEDIPMTAEWRASLMSRITDATPVTPSASRMSMIRLAVAVLLLIVVNGSFIIKVLTADTEQSSRRSAELQLISNQLLIEPISTK